MNEKDWIKTLKPGDEVGVVYAGPGREPTAIQKVAKVTPSGRVVLSNGMTFNPNGWLRGEDSPWRWSYLTEATPEVRLESERARLWGAISSAYSVLAKGGWRSADVGAMKEAARAIAGVADADRVEDRLDRDSRERLQRGEGVVDA